MSDQSEKVRQLTTMVERLHRRMDERVRIVTLPIPLSVYTQAPQENGVIFSFPFVQKGVMTRIVVGVSEVVSKEDPQFTIMLEHDGMKNGRGFAFPKKKKTISHDLELNVVPGDILEMVVLDPESVKGISLAVLIKPDRTECSVETVEETE